MPNKNSLIAHEGERPYNDLLKIYRLACSGVFIFSKKARRGVASETSCACCQSASADNPDRAARAAQDGCFGAATGNCIQTDSSPFTPTAPQAETKEIGGGIDTAEMYSAVEEAAILYASNYPDQAAALLLDFVQSHAESKELQPWMMLFDIYQTQGKKAQFEELALEFVVKFERSAPTWSDAKVPGAKVEKPKAGGEAAVEGYVALTGILQRRQGFPVPEPGAGCAEGCRPAAGLCPAGGVGRLG